MPKLCDIGAHQSLSAHFTNKLIQLFHAVQTYLVVFRNHKFRCTVITAVVAIAVDVVNEHCASRNANAFCTLQQVCFQLIDEFFHARAVVGVFLQRQGQNNLIGFNRFFSASVHDNRVGALLLRHHWGPSDAKEKHHCKIKCSFHFELFLILIRIQTLNIDRFLLISALNAVSLCLF